jgi:hypothetical protein
MKDMNLRVVKEVTAIDQFIAVMDFLNAMGYDTSTLTLLDAAVLKSDIVGAIETAEKLEWVSTNDQVTVY